MKPKIMNLVKEPKRAILPKHMPGAHSFLSLTTSQALVSFQNMALDRTESLPFRSLHPKQQQTKLRWAVRAEAGGSPVVVRARRPR